MSKSGSGAALNFWASGPGATARPIEGKLRDVISIVDYCAVCDGSTDDTAAVQATIDSVASGQPIRIEVPSGCHLDSSPSANGRYPFFVVLGEAPTGPGVLPGQSVRYRSTDAEFSGIVRSKSHDMGGAAHNVKAYDFPTQTPGGDLTGDTVANIVLTPVPLGVNHDNTAHYLYISGGTTMTVVDTSGLDVAWVSGDKFNAGMEGKVCLIAGIEALIATFTDDENLILATSAGTQTGVTFGGNEAVLIIGGSGHSGEASGSIWFTPAFGHAGAWTIKSASNGLQEMLWQTSLTGGHAKITTEITVHAQTSIPSLASSVGYVIEGVGMGLPIISRSSDYPAGDLLLYDQVAGNCALVIRDLAIYNAGPYGSTFENTSGAAIHLRNAGSFPSSIRDVLIDSGYLGVDLEGTQSILLDNVRFSQALAYELMYDSLAGVRIRTSAGISNCGVTLQNCAVSGGGAATAIHQMVNGVLIEASDGVSLVGCRIGRVNKGVNVSVTTDRFINFVEIDGCLFDTFQKNAIYVGGDSGVPTIVNTLRIVNSYIQNRSDIEAIDPGHGILIANNAYITKVLIANNKIANNGLAGIGFQSAANPSGNQEIHIVANGIYDNNYSASGLMSGIFFQGNWSNVSIVGNTIYNSHYHVPEPAGTAYGGHQEYGITSIDGTLTDCIIEGNSFIVTPGASAQLPLYFANTPVRGVIANNAGIDDVIGNVASGATITAPWNPVFTVTGTTPITTINGGHTGCKKRLIFTDAAPAGVATGGNIRQSSGAAQYGVIDLVFDGSYWNGGGVASGSGTPNTIALFDTATTLANSLLVQGAPGGAYTSASVFGFNAGDSEINAMNFVRNTATPGGVALVGNMYFGGVGPSLRRFAVGYPAQIGLPSTGGIKFWVGDTGAKDSVISVIETAVDAAGAWTFPNNITAATIKLTTGPGVGKALTSDADGDASWGVVPVSGSGTAETLPKFSAATTLADSLLLQGTTGGCYTVANVFAFNAGDSEINAMSFVRNTATPGGVVFAGNMYFGTGAYRRFATGYPALIGMPSTGGMVFWVADTAAKDSVVTPIATSVSVAGAWTFPAGASFVGNVSIGGTGPTSRLVLLDVTANTYQLALSGSGNIGEFSGIGFTDATGATKYGGVRWIADAANDTSLKFLTWDGTPGGTQRMVIRGAGGNVLIGTSDDDGTPATGRLVVKGSSADGSTLILVGRDSAEANVLTVDTDGNIVTPGLTTTGSFKMAAGAGAGKVFTSDGSGNASWGTAGTMGGTGTTGTLPKFSAATTLADSVLTEGTVGGCITSSSILRANAGSGEINAVGFYHNVATASFAFFANNIYLDGVTWKRFATGYPGIISFPVGGGIYFGVAGSDNAGTTATLVATTVSDAGVWSFPVRIETPAFKMATGAGAGKVLTSDGSGNGTWV
jgi:hypothetical protein